MAITGLLSIDPGDSWVAALRDLSLDVQHQCEADGFPGAGTTLSALIVERRRCVVLHVGDSRIYRLRAGTLQRLTADHNLGALRGGRDGSAKSRARRGSDRALTSYLGSPDPDQQIDVGTVSAEPGDRLLLCTDGIHEQLPPEEIAELLINANRCQLAAQQLVLAANCAGGRDNATALVVELGTA